MNSGCQDLCTNCCKSFPFPVTVRFPVVGPHRFPPTIPVLWDRGTNSNKVTHNAGGGAWLSLHVFSFPTGETRGSDKTSSTWCCTGLQEGQWGQHTAISLLLLRQSALVSMLQGASASPLCCSGGNLLCPIVLRCLIFEKLWVVPLVRRSDVKNNLGHHLGDVTSYAILFLKSVSKLD